MTDAHPTLSPCQAKSPHVERKARQLAQQEKREELLEQAVSVSVQLQSRLSDSEASSRLCSERLESIEAKLEAVLLGLQALSDEVESALVYRSDCLVTTPSTRAPSLMTTPLKGTHSDSPLTDASVLEATCGASDAGTVIPDGWIAELDGPTGHDIVPFALFGSTPTPSEADIFGESQDAGAETSYQELPATDDVSTGVAVSTELVLPQCDELQFSDSASPLKPVASAEASGLGSAISTVQSFGGLDSLVEAPAIPALSAEASLDYLAKALVQYAPQLALSEALTQVPRPDVDPVLPAAVSSTTPIFGDIGSYSEDMQGHDFPHYADIFTPHKGALPGLRRRLLKFSDSDLYCEMPLHFRQLALAIRAESRLQRMIQLDRCLLAQSIADGSFDQLQYHVDCKVFDVDVKSVKFASK